MENRYDLSGSLLHWYDYNKRLLPWRENKAPYRIWISDYQVVELIKFNDSIYEGNLINSVTRVFKKTKDEKVDAKHPKKVTLRKKKPQEEEVIEVIETVDDKGKKTVKKIKKQKTEIVEGFIGKFCLNII